MLCAQKDETIAALQKQVEYQQLQITSLQLQLAELRRMIFGSKAEKFVTSDNKSAVQPDLFPDDKPGQIDVVKTTLVKAYQKQQTKLTVKHPGRNPLPPTLLNNDGVRRRDT